MRRLSSARRASREAGQLFRWIGVVRPCGVQRHGQTTVLAVVAHPDVARRIENELDEFCGENVILGTRHCPRGEGMVEPFGDSVFGSGITVVSVKNGFTQMFRNMSKYLVEVTLAIFLKLSQCDLVLVEIGHEAFNAEQTGVEGHKQLQQVDNYRRERRNLAD